MTFRSNQIDAWAEVENLGPPSIHFMLDKTLAEMVKAWRHANKRLGPRRARSGLVNNTTFTEVIDFVAERFDVTEQDLIGPGLKRMYSDPRAVAMAMLYALGMSDREIGLEFNRERTSVTGAVSKCAGQDHLLTNLAEAVWRAYMEDKKKWMP